MARTGWRSFPFVLNTSPFARARLEPPEVVVVVESALLGRGELAAKEIYAASIAATSPGMAAAWKGAVGACNALPFRLADLIDIKIVVKRHDCAVEILATEKE